MFNNLSCMKELQQTKKISQLKTLMLGAASHEFRNPLSGLVSMLNILDTGVKEGFKHYL